MDLRISTADGRATVPMVIVGTEGGLLPVNPASAHGLVMAPAERYRRDLRLPPVRGPARCS